MKQIVLDLLIRLMSFLLDLRKLLELILRQSRCSEEIYMSVVSTSGWA